MKQKLLSIVALLLIFLVVLTSCAPAEPTAVEEEDVDTSEVEEPEEDEVVVEEPEEEEEESGGEPVVIGVYSLTWTPSSINAMKGLVDKFNAEHDGEIVAEYIQGDWGDVETYLTSGVSAGGGIADVVEYYLGGALDWYNQGYILDLSPYITGEIESTIPEILWDVRTAEDGAVFESCTNVEEHVLIYYNPALLEEAGIEPPAPGETWSLAELLENAKLLTVDADGNRLGEDGFDPLNVVQWGFVPRLDQEKLFEEVDVYATQITEKPLVRKGDDGTWDIIFDDEIMPTLESYLSIITDGITPVEAVGLGGSSQDELFFQGTAAMVQRGYFNIAVLKDNYPDFEFGVMPLPMERDVYFASAAVGQGFSVPTVSEHPEEAAEFVFWMQKPENQAIYSNSLMLAPCNPEAFEDPLIKDNPDWDVMRFYKDIQDFAEAEVNPNISEFRTTVYGPAMMDVLLGNMTLDEGIDLIKSVSKDVLNQ